MSVLAKSKAATEPQLASVRFARLACAVTQTSRFLVRWLVLWLFADFLFRPANLTQAIIVIRLETFIASRHSFIAGGQ